MKSIEGIPFYVPWITREDKKAVSEAMKSRWLTGGPKTKEFEEKFAKYLGVKHAIAVSSCTAALHLSMRLLEIGPGDEVIVPVFTFAATANAPIFCGAKPVFADIDEKTYNISPEEISEKMSSRTKAIVAVHYGGQACDMKEILEIAEDHKIHVVEDCAHSLGSEYKRRKTGSLGKLSCFSFYPTKIITTIEGGMITTDDQHLAARARILREHGMSKSALDREVDASWHYDIADLGYNYRLNEVQSALGISQLERVDEGIVRRIKVAHYYTRRLKHTGLILPYEAPDRSHVFHLYAIRILEKLTGTSRNELFKGLLDNQIGASVHYTPLSRMPFYKKFLNVKPEMFPVAEQVYNEIISLPLYPTMSRKDVDLVTSKIAEITG